MLDFIKLSIAVLSTWRISAILYYEDGPFAILKRGRRWLHLHAMPTLVPAEHLEDEHQFKHHYILEFAQGQLECFWCVSMWAGLFATLIILSPYWWVLVPFALSAGAILLSGGGRTIWRLSQD